MNKLPKTISEILKSGRIVTGRIGGKKLDFAPVIAEIIKSNAAWTVKDVHQNLVKSKLSRQRVYKLLEKAVKDKQLFKMELNGEGNYFDYTKRRVNKQ